MRLVVISRVGRTRQPGERYPSGKLKPTGEPIQPALWQRIRVDVAKAATDPRLACMVGRLSFHRELSDVQVAAAFRVAAIYGSFEQLNGVRRRMRSPSYEAGIGGGTPDRDEDFIHAVKVAYAALNGEDGFLSSYPSDWRNDLETLCCDDGFIPTARMPYMRAMLDNLAVFFGISKSKKRGQAQRLPHQTTAPTELGFKTTLVARARLIPADKTAYLALLAHLRPDLDEVRRERSWEIFQAMKDREQFNRSKGKR